jgi:flavodoxin I
MSDFEVIYYSRGGNTKRLADAIAGELGVKAVDVKTAALSPDVKITFLGSGSYGGKPGEDMVKFIQSGNFSGRKVALFGTSMGGIGKEVDEMAAALRQKGANVVGSYFCKGKGFLIFGRGHPNQDEIDGARKFAKEMAS